MLLIMLFSIVILTHDRVNLLTDAIETIQDGSDWELIIFDNASLIDSGIRAFAVSGLMSFCQ